MRALAIRCCCALLGLAAASAASSFTPGLRTARAEIELRPEVELEGEAHPVTLGEVAFIRASDLDLARALVALPIGAAPPPGRSAEVDRARIGAWLRARTGLSERQLDWRGSDRVLVQSPPAASWSLRIERVAADALRSSLAPVAAHVDMSLAQPLQRAEAPAGRVRLSARPVARPARPSGRVTVWVDVWADDRFIRSVPVAFHVDAYGAAATVAASRSEPASAPPAPLDAAGPSSPPRPPGVARGDWVDVRLVSGLVRLDGRAQALQPGEVGEVVRVRLAGAANAVEAKVVKPGLVEALP